MSAVYVFRIPIRVSHLSFSRFFKFFHSKQIFFFIFPVAESPDVPSKTRFGETRVSAGAKWTYESIAGLPDDAIASLLGPVALE
jgi:hypothetical protein